MTDPAPNIPQEPQGINTTVRTLGGLILCLLPLLMTSSTPPSALEQVQEDGYIQMLTLNGPSTYYEGPFGHAGFEYDLATAFANDLGVELTVLDKGNLGNILHDMGTTDGHFAAAGLSIIESRKKTINFSVPYSTVTQQVVYQRDTVKPKTIADLIGKDIIVIENSSHAATLARLKEEHPDLTWREKEDSDMAEMLYMVHHGEADFTLVDSTAFITNSVVYPRARFAFNITEPENIAWAFPKQGDDSLLNAANTFIKEYALSGNIALLEEKYFSSPPVDESNALAFAERIEARLPQWIDFLKDSAKQHELDWLFLAAMSYQESLWNEDAKSFTGVRGLMMLTNHTAKDLGIEDRTDPQQSIEGGARYFEQMRNRLPKDITEPDKTWMALAAYNVGLGHLEDARVLTQKQGGNPDLWEDVKESLPLLTRRKYYSQTRHGYARGWEPVHYVKRIRNYHNILVWHFENKQRQIASETEAELPSVSTNNATDSMSQL
jgi:membrane-bound lytic murein transglycosylase F